MCYHANIYDLDAYQMDKILMPGVNAKNASCKHTSFFLLAAKHDRWLTANPSNFSRATVAQYDLF